MDHLWAWYNYVKSCSFPLLLWICLACLVCSAVTPWSPERDDQSDHVFLMCAWWRLYFPLGLWSHVVRHCYTVHGYLGSAKWDIETSRCRDCRIRLYDPVLICIFFTVRRLSHGWSSCMVFFGVHWHCLIRRLIIACHWPEISAFAVIGLSKVYGVLIIYHSVCNFILILGLLFQSARHTSRFLSLVLLIVKLGAHLALLVECQARWSLFYQLLLRNRKLTYLQTTPDLRKGHAQEYSAAVRPYDVFFDSPFICRRKDHVRSLNHHYYSVDIVHLPLRYDIKAHATKSQ